MLNHSNKNPDEEEHTPLITWLVTVLFLLLFVFATAVYVWKVGDFWSLLA